METTTPAQKEKISGLWILDKDLFLCRQFISDRHYLATIRFPLNTHHQRVRGH